MFNSFSELKFWLKLVLELVKYAQSFWCKSFPFCAIQYGSERLFSAFLYIYKAPRYTRLQINKLAKLNRLSNLQPKICPRKKYQWQYLRNTSWKIWDMHFWNILYMILLHLTMNKMSLHLIQNKILLHLTFGQVYSC